MSSILTSQGMVLATAMAVSGTVILLAFRLQKSIPPTQFSMIVNPIPPGQSPDQALPRSCISRSSSSDGKKKDKKKKRVHFAADVVDTTGKSDEYRKKLHLHTSNCHNRAAKSASSTAFKNNYDRKVQKIPANRAALYNGILRERVLHRATYSY